MRRGKIGEAASLKLRGTQQMHQKVAVQGDVSQLVAGNVVHEAPETINQINSSVTYNVQAIPEPLYLLWRQRRAISEAVDEVARLEGIDRLSVYQVVLDNHGARSMKTMPRERYRAIMDDLARWMREAREGDKAANDDAAEHIPTLPVDIGTKETRRATWSKWGALHWLVSISAVAASGFVLIGQASRSTESLAGGCLFDGKRFSVGSVVSMPARGTLECVTSSRDAVPPYWAQARGAGTVNKQRR